jgi:hypothetical protein
MACLNPEIKAISIWARQPTCGRTGANRRMRAASRPHERPASEGSARECEDIRMGRAYASSEPIQEDRMNK